MDDNGGDVGALALYEDVISEVLAGRTEGHKCPYCGEGELDCSFDGDAVKISCPQCGRYFEGMLA